VIGRHLDVIPALFSRDRSPASSRANAPALRPQRLGRGFRSPPPGFRDWFGFCRFALAAGFAFAAVTLGNGMPFAGTATFVTLLRLPWPPPDFEAFMAHAALAA
jgi:hypothetical protein